MPCACFCRDNHHFQNRQTSKLHAILCMGLTLVFSSRVARCSSSASFCRNAPCERRSGGRAAERRCSVGRAAAAGTPQAALDGGAGSSPARAYLQVHGSSSVGVFRSACGGGGRLVAPGPASNSNDVGVGTGDCRERGKVE